MGQAAWCLGMLVEGVASASFILLAKMRRSSSMSLKPFGGGLRFEAWRMAGIFFGEVGSLVEKLVMVIMMSYSGAVLGVRVECVVQ